MLPYLTLLIPRQMHHVFPRQSLSDTSTPKPRCHFTVGPRSCRNVARGVVRARFRMIVSVLHWLAELHVVQSETGATMGVCGGGGREGGSAWGRVRLVHILVGDGFNRNENATKTLWRYFAGRSTWCELSLKYRLVTIRCAAHQVNLVVVAATCGQLSKQQKGARLAQMRHVSTCIVYQTILKNSLPL